MENTESTPGIFNNGTSSDVSSNPSIPITLSTRAIEEVKTIMLSKNVPPEYSLRIGVKGGGCSGLSYLLAFDKKREFDDEYPVDNFSVVIDKRHMMYIMGMHVDFRDGLDSRGFTFNNPNAKGTCGCGNSFSS